MDELLRALFGMMWCWPGIWLSQKIGLKPLPTAVAVTVWMVPGWLIYRLAMRLL